MILIKDLGMLETPNGKKKVRFGIYECPICRKFLKFRTANVINKSSTKCKRCAITIRNTKHGMTGTRVHGVWLGMLARCEHKYHSGYGNYGGRGITVCNEWHDFEVFHAWVLENKQTPNTREWPPPPNERRPHPRPPPTPTKSRPPLRGPPTFPTGASLRHLPLRKTPNRRAR